MLPSTRSNTNRKLTPADLIRRNKLSGGSFQRLRARPRASPGDALRLCNQRHDMRGPFLQRLLALGMVIGAVIGAGDTRLVAGLIDRGLDNVRLHAKLAHASRHRPSGRAALLIFTSCHHGLARADDVIE